MNRYFMTLVIIAGTYLFNYFNKSFTIMFAINASLLLASVIYSLLNLEVEKINLKVLERFLNFNNFSGKQPQSKDPSQSFHAANGCLTFLIKNISLNQFERLVKSAKIITEPTSFS